MGKGNKKAQTGQFTKTHYAWKQGMAAWEVAEKISELSSLFSVAPPPLPSSPPPLPTP